MGRSKLIGFIGLGAMGKPMALNLLKAGHAVMVWARKPAVTEALAEAGAEVAPDLVSLAKACQIIITMVTNSPDVEAILFGEEGLHLGLQAKTIVIDMSTIEASRAREFATRLQAYQVDFLDAPVSGGEIGAINGTLSIMVGGDAAVLASVTPVLKAMGQTIVHIGEVGAGQITKSCNQLLIAQTLVAIGEAFALAKANGIDPAKVREALLGGFAQSRILEIHGQRYLDNNFKPGFTTQLFLKDLKIVWHEIMKCGLALPATAYAQQLLCYLNASEFRTQDYSTIMLIAEKMNQHT